MHWLAWSSSFTPSTRDRGRMTTEHGPTPHDPRVLVVGAGVTGLAAAHRLRTSLGPAARITVVEASRNLGGKLAAVDLGGVRVDVGAEAFLARRPEAAERIAELGLTDDLVHPGTASSLVRAGGENHRLPARTVMGVPADPATVTPLLSAAGAAALRHEPAGPAWEPGQDAAVGALVRARIGDEVADRVVDPLLGGVYAGHADGLGVRATVPALADALDADPRSLVDAARAALPAAPPEGTAPAPVFGTLRGGLADLPAALALASRADVRLGRTVTALERTPDGWTALVAEPGSAGDDAGPATTRIDADAVVLAIPAPALRRLLADHAPLASAAAGAIELASSALVAMAFPPDALAADHAVPDCPSGVLVGSRERRPDGTPWTLKAVTFSSAKWPHLAPSAPSEALAPSTFSNPDEPFLLRASIGRHGDAASLQRDDDELVAAVREDLTALVGVDAEPWETMVVRWGGGLPQYGVGHQDRVAAIEDGVAALPGVAVAGAALHGVGVPACLATADAAVARVVEHLRMTGVARGVAVG